MSNLKNIQRKLCEGVSGWLLFEFNCLRGPIFNEKYISYPIGQILNSITEYKTKAELNHPCSNKGRGRPLQIDFVLASQDSPSIWKYAFESKWVGNSNITINAMIWDLIRLQNLFSYHSDIRCYFILAGFEKKISGGLLKDFDIAYIEGMKKVSGLTTVNNSKLTFNLKHLDSASKNKINENIQQYPQFSLYSKIICKPAHYYPRNDIVNMTFSTYVFEVLSPNTSLKVSSLE